LPAIERMRDMKRPLQYFVLLCAFAAAPVFAVGNSVGLRVGFLDAINGGGHLTLVTESGKKGNGRLDVMIGYHGFKYDVKYDVDSSGGSGERTKSFDSVEAMLIPGLQANIASDGSILGHLGLVFAMYGRWDGLGIGWQAGLEFMVTDYFIIGIDHQQKGFFDLNEKKDKYDGNPAKNAYRYTFGISVRYLI